MASRPSDIERRQAVLADTFCENVAPYVESDVADLELRAHQPQAFEELRDFFEQTRDEVGRSIKAPLPPNGGKSLLGVLVAKLAGVGDPSLLPGERPLRSLTLVPRRLALHQTIEAVHKFAPDLTIAQHTTKADANDTDNTVLTYQAAITMERSDWLELASNHDILALDENHRALGPETSDRVREAMSLGLTTLALSATPDFDDSHNTGSVLGIQRSLTPISPREAVEMGIANGVRLYALYTDQKVFLRSSKGYVLGEEMDALRNNRMRNNLIVDIIQDEAVIGRSGIVQCLSGGESPDKHPEIIAKLAKRRVITDPVTNEPRTLRVEAVGSMNSDTENDRRVKAFRYRQLDALTFSHYLIEAFDYPLEYLVCNPTSSQVVAGQITGRAARLHDSLTDIFVLVDHYRAQTSKRLLTPFDVFGESHVTEQGLHITRTLKEYKPYRYVGKSTPSLDRAEPEPQTSLTEVPPSFSESVLAALDRIRPGTHLDELLVARSIYDKPPEGYVPLVELPVVKAKMYTPEGARYVLSDLATDDGRPYFLNVRTGTYAQYVLPEADELLQARAIQPAKHVLTRNDISTFFVSEGWPRPNFTTIVQNSQRADAEYQIAKKTLYFSVEAARKVLLHIIEIPFMDPLERISVAELAPLLGYTSINALRYIVSKKQDHFPSKKIYRCAASSSPYKPVETVSLEDVYKFMDQETTARLKPFQGKSLRTIKRNIDKAAQRNNEYYQQHNLRTVIGKEAVERFLAEFSGPRSAATAAKKNKAPTKRDPSTLPPAPALLDASYALSGYGEDWSEHMACEGKGDDFFFPKGPEAVKHAKKLCDGCAVKGDCLLSELKHPTEQIAGGFTERERRRFSSLVIDWLRATR